MSGINPYGHPFWANLNGPLGYSLTDIGGQAEVCVSGMMGQVIWC